MNCGKDCSSLKSRENRATAVYSNLDFPLLTTGARVIQNIQIMAAFIETQTGSINLLYNLTF